MLLIALLMVALLLVAGIGLLSRKGAQFGRPSLEKDQAQALLLARSGVEDALLKLEKDPTFPPQGAEEQHVFTYTVEVEASGDLVGKYEVSVDSERAIPESYVILIRSKGAVGTGGQDRAIHTLEAEVDMDPDNPTYFDVINLQSVDSSRKLETPTNP